MGACGRRSSGCLAFTEGRDEALILAFGVAVALARDFGRARAIEHGHHPAGAWDCPCGLQRVERHRHSRAPDGQHFAP